MSKEEIKITPEMREAGAHILADYYPCSNYKQTLIAETVFRAMLIYLPETSTIPSSYDYDDMIRRLKKWPRATTIHEPERLADLLVHLIRDIHDIKMRSNFLNDRMDRHVVNHTFGDDADDK